MPAFLRRILPGSALAPGWLVVELDEGKAGFAHVRPNGARPVLEFAEERDWDPAEPKSLERVAREFGAHRFRCTTLLKPADYQIMLVEAPAVKPDELKAAVRWRIKDMLEYHVDDATVDVLDVPVPAGTVVRTHYMYSVAARTDTIRGIIDRFTAARIPLSVIDIPDTAQRNLAACLPAEERGTVILSFDDHGGLLTVSRAGELYLSRRLDIAWPQLAETDAAEEERLLDRVLVETQRSLDHCERTYPFFSLARVVLGALPPQSRLRQHLAANLYLAVEPLELPSLLQLPDAAAQWSGAQQARWLRAIGAGLRVEKKAL